MVGKEPHYGIGRSGIVINVTTYYQCVRLFFFFYVSLLAEKGFMFFRPVVGVKFLSEVPVAGMYDFHVLMHFVYYKVTIK